VAHASRTSPRCLRVHRGLVQHRPAAFNPRLPQPGPVRSCPSQRRRSAQATRPSKRIKSNGRLNRCGIIGCSIAEGSIGRCLEVENGAAFVQNRAAGQCNKSASLFPRVTASGRASPTAQSRAPRSTQDIVDRPGS
jgi:hypothetical protein